MKPTNDTGTTLEKLVAASAKLLASEGLRLKQTSARFIPAGRIGRGGMAKGRVVAKGDLDFVGDFRGRSVTFDAKSTKVASRFDLALIKAHQATICKRAHERGAIAFFLVEFSQLAGGPRYFAMDWPLLKSFWTRFQFEGEPASIPFVTIEAHCIEFRRAGNVLDLVETIKALQARRDGEVADEA